MTVDESSNAEAAYLWKILSEDEVKCIPFRFLHANCRISRSAPNVIQVLTNLVNVAILSSATEWN